MMSRLKGTASVNDGRTHEDLDADIPKGDWSTFVLSVVLREAERVMMDVRNLETHLLSSTSSRKSVQHIREQV